jgi:IclR family pca regulon transcriptional regulator
MTSFARGLAVVQAFTGRKNRMTISQVGLRTGFSRAAVRRCLYTLVKLGFAGTDDNRHFYLRPTILSLGYSYVSSMPLAFAAQPVLEQLSNQARESCWIGILEGNETVCVAHANATRLLSVDVHVGTRWPVFSTSAGRVLLANATPEEQESCIGQTEFRHCKKNTPYTATKLRQILSRARRMGYAIVDQELEVGVWALAVPIHGPSGGVVAALTIAMLAQRVSSEEVSMNFLSRLRDGARELSILLK